MASQISLLYPPDYDRTTEVPMKDFKFIKPLQIDSMVVLIRDTYRGVADLDLSSYFSTDPKVLEYRLAVVEDLIQNKELYDVFCKAVNIIYDLSDLRRAWSSDFTVETALGAARYMEMYQEIVNLFADAFRNIQVKSEGMKYFKQQIMDVAESEEYRNLTAELGKRENNFGLLKSVTIGMNLDKSLRPTEAGIVSINMEPFHPGTIVDKLLKKNPEDSRCLVSPLYPLPKIIDRNDVKTMNISMNGSLYTIFSKALRSFESSIHNYYNANTAVFVALLDDIRFLTAGVGFILSMQEKGYTMCKPTVAAMAEKKCELEQVYNPMLVKKSVENTIVSNSFTFDENGRFYIVTGPNHGGKSIFAYSVGMAQALFQLGLFVPAESAVMSPVSAIYTHFPSSDENNYGKGRLESECARLSEILKELTDTDMLLMDESFSSTSGLEAGYIASEVLTGIGVIGCCGIFVTHIHDLPQQLDTYNSHPDNKGKIDNLVAQMEDKESGTRSYKVTRTTPDGLSYARDIAKRYGLNLEGILGETQKN